MRLFLVLTLTVLLTAALVDSGRIVRTWRRRGGGGVLRRQSSYPWSPYQYWTRYFRRAPRIIRRQHNHQIPAPLLPQHAAASQQTHAAIPRPTHHHGRSKALSPWRPLEYGNPITRDPTFDYAPPTNENVKFGTPPDSRRRQLNGPPGRNFWRPRPPPRTATSLWRLLTRRQRRPMRPRFPRPPPKPQHSSHQQSDEAEVTPYLPNIVYFQPKDFIPTTPGPSITTTTTTENSTATGMKPGHVSDVPLYPTQATSASEFQPVVAEFKPMPVEKEYIFRVVSVTGLNKEPLTVVEPVPVTEAPPAPTERTAQAPIPEIATESILELLQQPPSPINSFNINIDPGAEGSDNFLKFVQIPTTPTTTATTTTTKVTTPRTTSTTQKFVPIFPVRISYTTTTTTTTTARTTTSTPRTTTTTSTTTTEAPEEAVVEEVDEEKPLSSTTAHPAHNHRHPTMTAYKKRPVFPKKPAVVSKTSSGKASPGLGSGESITITGIRSKVKEYKPQHLANYTQLLAFDKVAEASSPVTTPLPTSPPSSSPSESTTPSSDSVTPSSSSPMQQFDPLKLIHSWFIKS